MIRKNWCLPLVVFCSILSQPQETLALTHVLDFNSLSSISGGGLDVGNPLVEDGFRLFDPSLTEPFDYFLSLQDGWQNNRGSSNGTTTVYKLTDSNTEVAFSLSAVNGNPFDLISIDVAEVFNVGDFGFDYAARTVVFTGHLSGGGVVGQNFDLDLISDGQGGREDFETVFLSSSFQNLTSVDISASSGQPTITYFNFDNIVVSAIPEPATPMLALAGVPLLLRLRRRVR